MLLVCVCVCGMLFCSYLYGSGLGVDPCERGLLLSEPPNTPKASREKTMEAAFEHLHVPAAYLANVGSLALYAAGVW